MPTTFNCFVDTIGVNTMTAVGGTALEILSRTTLDGGGNPSNTLHLQATASGQKVSAKVHVPEALDTALKAGGTVLSAAVHANLENQVATGKNAKFGILEPAGNAVTSEPELVKTVQVWKSVAIPKANELKTKELIEALVPFAERLTAKELWTMEIYISVEVEEAAAEEPEEDMLV